MGEEKLFEEYGIITEWKNGKPYFSGLGKVMAATLYGNSKIYDDVSKSMADIEKTGEYEMEEINAEAWKTEKKSFVQ